MLSYINRRNSFYPHSYREKKVETVWDIYHYLRLRGNTEITDGLNSSSG